jgi:hypothetical protein
MRLDLAERLRCPRPHGATPLVVVASEVVERDLRRGIAGCPVCRFEARFAGGDVFADGVAAQSRAAGVEERLAEPSERTAALDRLIALLGLAEPGGAVLLTGEYASHAPALALRCELAVVTDRAVRDRALEDPVSAIVGFGDAIPFGDGTFRAAALGAATTPAQAAEATRCIVTGGRLVGAVTLSLPAGARELARDEREWVAETDVRATIVGLTRRT